MPNRIIKESLCSSEKIASLSDFEFRLWVGLITQADDAGRGDARPAIIKGRVFPFRERLSIKDIDAALQALAAKGCVSLYTVDGKPYFLFPGWVKHQRVRDCKPKFPEPPEKTRLHDSAASCGELPQTAALIQSESESESESNPKNDSAEPQAASTPPAICLPLNDGTEYPVSVEQCHEWAGLYPAIDVIQQLRQMKGWLDANPAKRKTKRGVNAFIVRWLAKEQDRGGTAAQRAGKPGYRAQGHNDELDPLERAAVDRLVGQPQRPLKGVEKLQYGVQRHGDELSAFQLEAIDRMLESGGDAAGGAERGE